MRSADPKARAIRAIRLRPACRSAAPRLGLIGLLFGLPIPTTTADTWALYYNAHQFLQGDAECGWGVFTRLGVSDGNPNVYALLGFASYLLGFGLSYDEKAPMALGICTRNVGPALATLMGVAGAPRSRSRCASWRYSWAPSSPGSPRRRCSSVSALRKVSRPQRNPPGLAFEVKKDDRRLSMKFRPRTMKGWHRLRNQWRKLPACDSAVYRKLEVYATEKSEVCQ